MRSASSMMQTIPTGIGRYAVMPPRPGLASYGSPGSRMISGTVFGMRPSGYY